MRTKSDTLSPHSQKILALLHKTHAPLTAYEILERLRKFGIKAPPTVYRALDALVSRGLVHKIESLNAFVACHEHENHAHAARFAVCRDCGTVAEIEDEKLTALIAKLGRKIKFHIEREMIELLGLCDVCAHKKAKA